MLIPIEITEEFKTEIKNQIFEAFEDSLENIKLIYSELPPFATKRELMKILRIGNDKLNDMFINGLQQTKFGENDYRIAREDLLKYFSENKI